MAAALRLTEDDERVLAALAGAEGISRHGGIERLQHRIARGTTPPLTTAMHPEGMPVDPDLYFDLCQDELREVTRFALASAQDAADLLGRPTDPRIPAALDAARRFADGERRSTLQRVASLDAHRAAKDADDPVTSHAASAARDAAGSAYLHPFAKGTQVAHILRSTAHAALAAEAAHSDGDPSAALATTLTRARDRATPTLLDVLSRYPAFPRGRTRVAQIVSDLDASLRGDVAHDDDTRSAP